MALDIPVPPVTSRQKLVEGLQRMPGRPADAKVYGLVGGAAPDVSHSHQVFSLGLRDLVDGGGLGAAHGVGWRYLLVPSAPGGSALSAAEVKQVGDQHSFSQVQGGWLPEETRKVLETAETLPQVAQGDYELRTLRIPAIPLDAVWLKDKAGNNDLLLPIRSNVKDLVSGQVYAAPDFLAKVRDASAKTLAFNDRPQRP
jgi:hypothetical protein